MIAEKSSTVFFDSATFFHYNFNFVKGYHLHFDKCFRPEKNVWRAQNFFRQSFARRKIFKKKILKKPVFFMSQVKEERCSSIMRISSIFRHCKFDKLLTKVSLNIFEI